MRCIVCKTEILAVEERGEPNPDYVEPPGMDKLVNSTMWHDGVVDFIYPGYGSCHDTTKIRIAVCDVCLTDRLKDDTIQDCGSYI